MRGAILQVFATSAYRKQMEEVDKHRVLCVLRRQNETGWMVGGPLSVSLNNLLSNNNNKILLFANQFSKYFILFFQSR